MNHIESRKQNSYVTRGGYLPIAGVRFGHRRRTLVQKVLNTLLRALVTVEPTS